MKKQLPSLVLSLVLLFSLTALSVSLLTQPFAGERGMHFRDDLPLRRFMPEKEKPLIGRIETLDVVEVIGEEIEVAEPSVEPQVEMEVVEVEPTEEVEVAPTPSQDIEPTSEPQVEMEVASPEPAPEEPLLPEKEEAPKDEPTLGLDGNPGPPTEEEVQEAFPDSKH